ncbi:HEAT repeat domain-containing protein [Halobellus sp. Atlit-38R]|uniref:HEAT repeat domain-containing protein n=1 Tax=Halobellus sp. Atlit-38R TaxID=2282131 RepID=UPI000EF2004D|nr:HEAT repeat domain-containing protein [Halobellus sp. Atlit-38R]RLM89175.1 HEAT repeat domain-containing protein [Halobellus sp. Atlit-38R]
MANEPEDDVLSLYELVRDGKTKTLIRYLKRSNSPQTRETAAERLGDFADIARSGDETLIIRALITAVLEDESSDVRARAVDSLDRHGREAIDQLITEIADFDAGQAPDWLTSKKLVEWLDSEQVEFQLVAASALGRIGDEHVVPYLVEAFDDLDPRVRERAVSACGLIGDPRAIDALANRLDDSERIVQQAAAEALTMIGTQAALERLIPAAQSNNKRVRYIAVSELSQLRNAKPLTVLVERLTDESSDVRQAATLSLIELIAADTDADDEIRQAVTDQMRTIDDAELIPRLLDILSDTSRTSIKRTVVWLLGRVVDPTAADIDAVHEALLGLLDAEAFADEAADSLAELESKPLENRLLAFIRQQDGSTEAKERAQELLERIDVDRVDDSVRDSVEYTYVRDPADYTRQKEKEKKNEGN